MGERRLAASLAIATAFLVSARGADPAPPRSPLSKLLDPVREFVLDLAKDEPYFRVVSRTIDDERAVGFDYTIDYARTVKSAADAVSGWQWDASIRSRGILASESGANRFDSLISEAAISGSFFLPWDAASLRRTESLERELRGLLDEPPEDEAELARRKAASQDLDRFLRSLRRARFATVDIHAKHEGTQRFDDNDAAFGGGIAFDSDTIRIPGVLAPSDIPNALLDLLRSDDELRRVHPGPRFYIGCDAVTGLRHTERKRRTGDDRNTIPRATFQAAWRADFLRHVRLKVAWQSTLEIAPPSAVVRADREFNSHVELSLGYRIIGDAVADPVRERRREKPPSAATFVVQYQEGRLPPNYDLGSTVGIGLEAEF